MNFASFVCADEFEAAHAGWKFWLLDSSIHFPHWISCEERAIFCLGGCGTGFGNFRDQGGVEALEQLALVGNSFIWSLGFEGAWGSMSLD